MPNGAKNWCFTLNNPTDDEEQKICDTAEGDETVYLVFGRETGEQGTRHLQGYVSFGSPKTLRQCKALLSSRIHAEVRKGTHYQAAEYCKKDGDYEEFGTTPMQQGKRTDIDRFVEWVKGRETKPPDWEIIREFPGLWVRYERRLKDIVSALWTRPRLTSSEPRDGWQRELVDRVMGQPDERVIEFLVDPTGGAGKTWIAKYLIDEFPNDVQYLRIGKRDDLAFTIDETKRVFLFDIPRGQMEYFQYPVAEMLKDRLVYSPKYDSRTKVLTNTPHVIVLANEVPDMNSLSNDRYVIIHL